MRSILQILLCITNQGDTVNTLLKAESLQPASDPKERVITKWNFCDDSYPPTENFAYVVKLAWSYLRYFPSK